MKITYKLVRYNKVSMSIDTLGTVIDKYRYFPVLENSENSGKIRKNIGRKWNDLETIPGTF